MEMPVDLSQRPQLMLAHIGHFDRRARVRYFIDYEWVCHLFAWEGKIELQLPTQRAHAPISNGTIGFMPPHTPLIAHFTAPSNHHSIHFRLNNGAPNARLPVAMPLGEHAARITGVLNAILQLFPTSPLRAEVKLWDVLGDVAALWEAQSRETSFNEPQPVRIASDFIARHFASPLCVAQIADVAKVSPSHLNRLFRAVRGHNIVSELRLARAQHAEFLLRHTQQSSREIASAVGVRDAQALNKLVREFHGQSPRALRSRNLPIGEVRDAPMPD